MSLSQMNKPGQLVPVKLWTPIHEVESSALDQLSNVAKLPWVFHHVAVMPDVHAGNGCTVGSVIAMKDAVAPAAVGVDIGCGMGAIRTSLVASELPDNLDTLRSAIEAAIPVGFMSHDGAVDLPESSRNYRIRQDVKALFDRFKDLSQSEKVLHSTATRQLGTLGGGNHFIEVCLDEGSICPGGFDLCDELTHAPRVWLMLHSGSRNIGKELAEIHIEMAQRLVHNQGIPDRDMAVFLAGTSEMKAYWHDLSWAQEYAFLNRLVMFELLKSVFSDVLGLTVVPENFNGVVAGKSVSFADPILCHHNYVAEEPHFGEDVFVTRKGAINAETGRMGIIPGSMGTQSYIVRGLGSEESFKSASHGAGRKMSRGAAKRKFTLEDLKAQTAGVCCRKDKGVLDEIPGAYKDVEQVMANQSDLVEIVHTLKQVLCVKG
jgi:tRNA-splicing ligase RtcB (3'-phosphate/5'-hydroxy nucleic acid ligase)